MFFYRSKRIKSMTPSSLSSHYAAQSPSGRKPDLVAKEVLEWWQTNGKHPFIQPHISSPSNVGANSPENLPLGDKVQLIRLPIASPSAVKEFSQVSSEEPAHLTTVPRFPKGINDYYQTFRDNSPEHTKYSQPEFRRSFV
ncbi:hypothetical protein F4703DRAFT_1913892 [Phycomyces blakesleeanus]